MTRWVLPLLLFASSAAAQSSLVDEGWARYAEAEFEAATEAFDAAEARGGLTRSDLLRLLEGRALVSFAREDVPAMERALRHLADVAPQHALAPDAPPEIARAFLDARRAVGEPIRVALDYEEIPGGARLVGTVSGDDDGLVLDVRVVGRSTGGWRSGSGAVDVLEPELRVVEGYVEAIGPGGAVVARRGSEHEPLRFEVGPPVVPPARPRARNIAIGASAGAVAVLAIVVAVLVARSGDETQPGVPRVVELTP